MTQLHTTMPDIAARPASLMIWDALVFAPADDTGWNMLTAQEKVFDMLADGDATLYLIFPHLTRSAVDWSAIRRLIAAVVRDGTCMVKLINHNPPPAGPARSHRPDSQITESIGQADRRLTIRVATSELFRVLPPASWPAMLDIVGIKCAIPTSEKLPPAKNHPLALLPLGFMDPHAITATWCDEVGIPLTETFHPQGRLY